MKKKSFLIIFSLLFNYLAFGQVETSVTEVTKNLYMISGYGGNVAFLVTTNGVIVVDAGTAPSHGTELVEKIKEKTNQPIKYLIYTHYHFDHIYGACNFPEHSVVIAHENTMKNIEENYLEAIKQNVETRLPDLIKQSKEKIKQLKTENSTDLQAEKDKLDEYVKMLEEYKKL